MIPSKLVDSATGSLMGLALGDALGTTLEFKPKDSYEHITDMVGGGPFDLLPGQWTDDTSMMLCLADSLIETESIDLVDQMNRYCRWFHDGENSVTGKCFDIGITVQSALKLFEVTGDPKSGSTDPYSAGNGSLMRLAPLPLFLHKSTLNDLFDAVSAMSESTHAEPRCIQACQLMAFYLHRIYNVDHQMDKDVLLRPDQCLLKLTEQWDASIKAILNSEFKTKKRDQIHGTGFVVQSLEAALWCFMQTDDFESGALLAANLGEDADTSAAIYGQLAGAYYGFKGLPDKWLVKLAWKGDIEDKALKLVKLAIDKPLQYTRNTCLSK